MKTFEPQSILCGIDFSPASQTALTYTSVLAQAYRAKVAVLHSHHVEIPAYLGGEQWAALKEQLAATAAASAQAMREFAAPALGTLAPAPEFLPMDAPPVEGLLKTIADRQPDLVVLGSHGHNRLNRFLLGSVSASVLREIASPLLIARQRPGTPVDRPEIKHVLCPVNYTATAAAGLQAAASLAQRLEARLSVIHSLEGHGDTDAERERLCQWVPTQVQVNCNWESSPVVHGPAAERIVQAAEDMGADLIVIGGRRRSLLTATILGATTERIVQHATCPVLTIVSP